MAVNGFCMNIVLLRVRSCESYDGFGWQTDGPPRHCLWDILFLSEVVSN